MKTIYHGTRHYAVYGRKVGTFGGKSPHSTLRIHDTTNMGPILVELSREESTSFRYAASQRPDREYVEAQLLWLLEGKK